ncbi:ATP synthase F0 subunit A [bacterium]|nr:ATP synthase F0 subunit A [bacterium]|tara:strand:+ start:3690 stop:4544 length:855 start_codon:yes stop_codon:yes gene_type:complete
MDNLGEVSQATITLFGLSITYNPVTFLMTWIVIAFILILAFSARKKLSLVPGFLQSIFELIYDFLKEITLGTLGDEDGKKHLPFIISLFVFILCANWIGIIPNLFAMFGTFLGFLISFFDSSIIVSFNSILDIKLSIPDDRWFSFLFDIPAFEEPTRSVNMDLALGLLVFAAVQAYGVKNKGFWGYLKSYYNDPFPMKGWRALFFFLNPFFYLNLIGAVANVVSHSFRLFGNIFGGGMIIVIVSSLLKFFIVPVGLFAFFGIFAGLVQAFVFTMLAVTYIQQQQ